jgi:outer membrane protein assembly factor BamB
MKNMKHMRMACLIFTLLLSSEGLRAQDWPQWRGANRDAKSAGFDAPKTWPKELTQKWKITIGDGVSSPALVGDKIYAFSREGGSEIIRCLEAGTGKEVWQDKYDALAANGPASGFSGPRSSPAVANGKVLTIGLRGVVSCLDAASGKLLWRKDDFKAYPRFFESSSPMLLDEICVAQLGGTDSGAVVAYDIGSGAEKWKWTGDAAAYASPALMVVGGEKLIVALTEARIVALSAKDGKLKWETPFAVQGRGYNASTPVVDGSTLIYSGSGRGTTAVKLDKKGDALSATDLWKNPDNSVMFNTPVLKSGLVFGISAGNDIFCIDAKDGKTAWTVSASGAGGGGDASSGGRGGRGGRGGYGSVVDGGTVLLALTPSSELIAFEPNAKAFTELARIKVAGSATYAYPVVSGKRILIKDQDSLALYSVD